LAHNVGHSYLYAFLMDLSLSAPIWVLYLRDERGFSLTQITLLEVPLFLLIVFAEVPTGAVADRFGRRISLMLASGILAISMFVYGIATSYPVILISNLAWGLAFTFRSGADVALLYDSLQQAGREEEFQRASGRLFALRSGAMLAGLLIGAPLAAATSYSFAIVTTSALCAGALAVAFQQRDASIPDIPTFKEQGYDVVTAGSVKGVAVPKGTPKEIVSYLEKKYKDIAGDAEFQKIMKDIGQPVMYQTAEEYKVWFKQAYDQFGSLVKSLGIETK